MRPHVEYKRVTLSFSEGALKRFQFACSLRALSGNAYGVLNEVLLKTARALEDNSTTVELSLREEREEK